MIQIQINPGANSPIFRQIVDQVRGAAVAGRARVGDPLPSVRVLAGELVVNHNTVAKAYAELVRDGVLESQPGRGYFIAKRRQVYSKAERDRRLTSAIDPLVAEAVTLGFSPDQILAAVADRLEKFTAPAPASRT